MNLDEQIIALGTLDGYTDIHKHASDGLFWRGTKGGRCEPLPNYESLDVMHRMEKILTANQWVKFEKELHAICRRVRSSRDDLRMQGAPIHATAAQRREALLKTLNLWKP